MPSPKSVIISIKDYSNPHDPDNTYTWYDSNPETNGEFAGTDGDGTDTEDFLNTLNSAGFGGFSDWRLPAINELLFLEDFGNLDPVIDTNYFPNTRSAWYLSATTYADSRGNCWRLDFSNGYGNYAPKSGTYLVRAVRGGQDYSSDHFIVNDDGTITDTNSGLMWQRKTDDSGMNWQEALNYAENLSLAGYTDWRIPSLKELRTIVNYNLHHPAIDVEIFPDKVSSIYWSATTDTYSIDKAWCVHFLLGSRNQQSKLATNYVRAVRSGQAGSSDALVISTPARDSTWNIATSMSITWESRDIPGDVRISLSRDGESGDYETIAESTENDGSHTWTITGPESSDCFIKIEPLSDPSRGYALGPFTIEPVSIEPVSISGTILNSDGTPVTDISIEIWLITGDPCSHNAWSLVSYVLADPADGGYEFAEPAPGTYYLRTAYYGTAYANEWWAESASQADCNNAQSLTVGAGGSLTGKDFQLDPYTPPNRVPVANNGTLITDEGMAKRGQVIARDDDGDDLTYAVVTQAAKGNVNLTSGTGDYIYTPDPGESGADSFTFRANDGESDSNEATIAITVTPKAESGKKAIIVAGGGPYPGNNLWDATRECANYAYRALLYQEYRREDIYYLSPDRDQNIDIDGNNIADDIDADATHENLDYAITTWARNPMAEELLIYITDHGGEGVFILDGTKVPVADVTAGQLDIWLDDLQNEMTGRVIFIYDACLSGTFVPELLPPPGRERILITSASNDEKAYFMDNGKFSFSFQFWADIYNGSELDDAFFFGRDMMEKYQTALLDADGDGQGNTKSDKALANGIIIGRGKTAASEMPMPAIESVSDEQLLEGETFARLWAKGVYGYLGISRVWAVIIPPDFDPSESPDVPVTEFPTTELRDMDNSGLYEGVYENFTLPGTYNITIYATDTEGVYSLPGQTRVIQKEGIRKGDVNEDGDVNLKDAVTALKIAAGYSNHTASVAADVNENNKIGMEEVVYILQEVSETR